MKPRPTAIGLILLSLTLLACSLAGAATPSPDTGASPAAPVPSEEPTLPPLAPGTSIPTEAPLTPTATIAPSATPSPSATAAAPTVTLKPVSTGPLDFTVSIVGCRLDSTREGGVILTIRFDAKGGNGVYTYYRENQRTTRTFDRPATKGTAVIDSYRVESGDGQSVDRKERFAGSQFGCP